MILWTSFPRWWCVPRITSVMHIFLKCLSSSCYVCQTHRTIQSVSISRIENHLKRGMQSFCSQYWKTTSLLNSTRCEETPSLSPEIGSMNQWMEEETVDSLLSCILSPCEKKIFTRDIERESCTLFWCFWSVHFQSSICPSCQSISFETKNYRCQVRRTACLSSRLNFCPSIFFSILSLHC